MKKEVKEWAKVIIISAVIAVAITTVIRPTLVKGYSMYPTINQYDYLIISQVSYMGKQPNYGDIVVFKNKVENEKEKDLIKRVIGLPGDEISVVDGLVYRNGEAVDEPYVYGGFTGGNLVSIKVEDGTMFVMGDNRGNSLDSRDEQIGTVSMDKIEGKALMRVFPFTKMGKLE